MPEAELNLQVGSGSHAQQTAAIMTRFEPIVLETHPDMVLVYGDVNSTVAAALVCAKLLVPVAHVEAGLRSFDRTMPEEINRVVTDQLADLLLTPSLDGSKILQREGVSELQMFGPPFGSRRLTKPISLWCKQLILGTASGVLGFVGSPRISRRTLRFDFCRANSELPVA